MTDLTEMWRELERYQPFAEKHGFGDAWLRMTTERTESAAWDAACAATATAAWAAAWAAAEAAAEVAAWTQHAITYIRDAIEKEDKT